MERVGQTTMSGDRWKLNLLSLWSCLRPSWWKPVAGASLGSCAAAIVLHFKPGDPARVAAVYGLGLLVGLVVFVGPILVRQLLAPVVNSPANLQAASDTPVLVSIPRIPTPELLRLKRRERIRNWVLSIASIATLVVVVGWVA